MKAKYFREGGAIMLWSSPSKLNLGGTVVPYTGTDTSSDVDYQSITNFGDSTSVVQPTMAPTSPTVSPTRAPTAPTATPTPSPTRVGMADVSSPPCGTDPTWPLLGAGADECADGRSHHIAHRRAHDRPDDIAHHRAHEPADVSADHSTYRPADGCSDPLAHYHSDDRTDGRPHISCSTAVQAQAMHPHHGLPGGLQLGGPGNWVGRSPPSPIRPLPLTAHTLSLSAGLHGISGMLYGLQTARISSTGQLIPTGASDMTIAPDTGAVTSASRALTVLVELEPNQASSFTPSRLGLTTGRWLFAAAYNDTRR